VKVDGAETGVAVCGFERDVAEVVAGYVAGLLPGGGVIPGCRTGFSEHPDKITKAITRPVTRENTILLFNPASLPYYSDEFYGTAGKYIFTVSPDVVMKTKGALVATGRSFGQPIGGLRCPVEWLRRARMVKVWAPDG
jgi:hypothetical protein